MSGKTIPQLPGATIPLSGAEQLPLSQSGTTKNVSVANLIGNLRLVTRGAGWETSLGGALVAPLAQTIEIANRCVIRSISLLTDGGPGSCVIDLRRTQKPNIPGAGNSICGGAPPTISNANTLFLSSFAGWTSTQLEAGDLVTFYLSSSSNFSKITLNMVVEANI